MQVFGIGDEAANEFDAAAGALEQIAADGRISPDEEAAALEAIRQLSELRPLLEVIATSMAAIGQISHLGVVRSPNRHMQRRIDETRAYVRRAEIVAVNVVPFARKATNNRGPTEDNRAA